MSQASESSACCDDDGANIDLGSSLLLTSSSKYTRIWRRSLYIGIFISLKKPTTTTTASGSYEPPPSPQSSSLYSAPYTPLPPSASEPPARTSSAKSSLAIDIEEEKEEDVEERIRNDIARIVKEKDLKSLLELGGVDRVCTVLVGQRQPSEVSTEGTIDNGNHMVVEASVPVHRTSFSSFLLNTCKRNSYTISLLLISAVLSFAIEFKQEGPRYGWHDGVAIVFVVILLVAFSSIANFWRERNMMKLSKKLEFTVERGEERSVTAISDIVVGDKVFLRKGDKVPADGLLVSDDNFVLAEAIKSKSDCETERNPFLTTGSKVIEGDGWMLVTSVGNKMNLAEMLSSMSYNPEMRGLLDSQIEEPISYIDKFALFISALVALVVLIRLICKKDGDSSGLPEIKGKVSVGMLMEVLKRIFLRPQGSVSILTGLVTVAILCMQHGMPLTVTISLKYQIDKVVSNQVAVLNDLSACTTMGLVTVICIDASGGLIAKPLEVSRIWMGEKDISKVEGSQTDLVVPEVLQQGIGLLSVLTQEFSLSPMSNSLVSWAKTTRGMNINSFTKNFNILQHSKLNSDKECTGVLVRKVGDSEQVLHLHWSGAASTILDMCSLYYDSKGECQAMENQKIKFGQVIKEMEDSGLKPIAFAYRQTQVQELEQDGLILLGLIGLKHTCQETKLALKYLKNAGIQIKLVSEDDIMEVRAIACELGLEVPVDGIVLEGKELQDLNGSARLDKVDLALVMGGFRPEDMLLMVQCLQEKGHVVAFIGRRMTDSHASVLKVADVGIIHNSLSTIVDRESSGIYIKYFSALKPIVRAGRSTYHNIQKFIQLQLTLGISGSLITLITTMSTGESPLTAIQLIWVNMLMCLLGGLMMVMELNSQEQLANQPSPSDGNQSIITKAILKSIVIQVLYQASVSMILEFGGHVTDSQKEVRKTMIFNTFLLCQVFNQLNTMHLLKKEVFKIAVKSYCFLVALGACFLMQVLLIKYAKGLANCTWLNGTQWAICVLVGALSWVCELALNVLPVILSSNCASESITFWGFPFLMLLFLPVQYYT